tara:strand:- start:272 stop:520 length:249 start_codon:yes stop_codon:yes gene_type:complete
MHKFLLSLILLLLVSNCVTPGTALLSPIITGAKTKSIQQASLSLASSMGSSQLLRSHEKSIKKVKDKILNKNKDVPHSFHLK